MATTGWNTLSATGRSCLRVSCFGTGFPQPAFSAARLGTPGGADAPAALAGAASSSLTTFDIGPFLLPGTNLITVTGANGLGCGAGAYSCNPAGVVFGGSLSFQSDPLTKDQCKDGGWETFGFSNQGQCVRFVETGKDSR